MRAVLMRAVLMRAVLRDAAAAPGRAGMRGALSAEGWTDGAGNALQVYVTPGDKPRAAAGGRAVHYGLRISVAARAATVAFGRTALRCAGLLSHDVNIRRPRQSKGIVL
jgi:hypothetical protein